MRNALCLAVLALAFAVPAVAGREREPRRRTTWRQPAEELKPRHVAVLPVTALNGSSLVFATHGGFFATGVRFDATARDGLRSWTVGWGRVAARAAP